MTAATSLGLGLLAAVAGWLATRVDVGAWRRIDRRCWRWLLLDALLPAGLFGLLFTGTGRPLLSGLITLALGCGYAYAERAKRKALAEPIVFTDVFQAIDIFRHPTLAVPFQNRISIVLSTLAAFLALLALWIIEPPVSLGRPWSCFVLIGVLVTCGWLLAGPLNRTLAQALRHAGMHGDVFSDAKRFGTLACLLGYGIIARAERAGLQHKHAPIDLPVNTARTGQEAPQAPVLLIQCESFFDARRLGKGVVTDLLPAFDAARRDSLQWGRLAVPCWGANTVRTEFAVLSGLDESALGMDRFNPYFRLARRPIDSLAWQLRARGYHTACIHPFDRRFYGRDQVMPQLGFNEFIGEEAFTDAPRINGFVADTAIVEVIESLIAEHHRKVFVFVITIENHGPWIDPGSAPSTRLAPGLTLPPPETAALERYLGSLCNADRMLAELCAGGADGRLIGFYGDHQPSLHLSTHLRGDNASDYVIWHPGCPNAGKRHDLPAAQIAAVLLAALDIQPAG